MFSPKLRLAKTATVEMLSIYLARFTCVLYVLHSILYIGRLVLYTTKEESEEYDGRATLRSN